jgi:hypothetical protein
MPLKKHRYRYPSIIDTSNKRRISIRTVHDLVDYDPSSWGEWKVYSFISGTPHYTHYSDILKTLREKNKQSIFDYHDGLLEYTGKEKLDQDQFIVEANRFLTYYNYWILGQVYEITCFSDNCKESLTVEEYGLKGVKDKLESLYGITTNKLLGGDYILIGDNSVTDFLKFCGILNSFKTQQVSYTIKDQ